MYTYALFHILKTLNITPEAVKYPGHLVVTERRPINGPTWNFTFKAKYSLNPTIYVLIQITIIESVLLYYIT